MMLNTIPRRNLGLIDSLYRSTKMYEDDVYLRLSLRYHPGKFFKFADIQGTKKFSKEPICQLTI